MAESDEGIKEAIETLEEISSDEEKERIAELREKYIRDRNSEIKTARNMGLKQRLEEGRELGRKLGKEEGRKLGKEEERKKVKDIAKKMKDIGMDIKTIADITGLSKEEIKKI